MSSRAHDPQGAGFLSRTHAFPVWQTKQLQLAESRLWRKAAGFLVVTRRRNRSLDLPSYLNPGNVDDWRIPQKFWLPELVCKSTYITESP